MIQVIDRALDILELLGSNPEISRSLSEISGRTGLKKTTCANILKTLGARGYVEQTGGSRDYNLGFKAYKLVGSQAFYDRLGKLAAPALNRLFSATSETVVLAVIANDKRIVISNIELSSGITARINHSNTIYRSATGRVILAWYPEKKFSVTIDRIGLPDIADWPEVRDKEGLDSALAGIRKAGYAESGTGSEIVGVAVPIFKSGAVIASIGVCIPSFRCSRNSVEGIVSALKEAAAEIESTIAKGIMP